MRHLKLFFLGLSALTLFSCSRTEELDNRKLMAPVSFADVKIDDGFWSPRLRIHKDAGPPGS